MKLPKTANSKIQENSKFHFVKTWKSNDTMKKYEVPFERSHHRVSSTDSKLELHHMSPLLTLGVRVKQKKKDSMTLMF